ncbi:serine hydrolase domain-containing protein [Sphingomonas sp.]|uniref:serine hydrolase domain-containing protein n=1 Tax=Sphingomonas sp. TaxID=28214 RepID=UPI0031E1D350
MAYRINRRSLLTQTAAGAAAGLAAGRPALAQASPDIAPLIDAERAAVRAGMTEGGIGAAAICLIRNGEPAWLEGFGSAADGTGVTPDTLFSIQSTSKSFTATAVLLAVQEGLLDLDAPVTRYLPDFTVRSRFESAPQTRITLRLLLGNRAGFTHEAPVGNNYEPAAPSFAAHAASIAQTWLRFPVGERYRYSNLGYDLAGHILERASGMSYAEWLRRKLFVPLGMRASTADPAVYGKAANRAAGTHRGYAQVPLVTPLVASGGVWTTARDIAAYAAFMLARGAWRGKQVLAPELWAEMHGFGLGGDYGLGVMRDERRYGSHPVRLLHHRGGGFGFGCNLVYCPDGEVALAALFNRPALAGYQFGMPLLDKLLAARFGARVPRLPADALATIQPLPDAARALVGSYVGRSVRVEISESGGQLRLSRDGGKTHMPLRMTAPDELFTLNADGDAVRYRHYPAIGTFPAHFECSEGEASLDRNDGPADPAGPGKAAWTHYLGKYRIDQWGKPAMEVTVEQRRGHLYIDGIRLVVETEPGLFFTSDGEAVDFRSAVPTWRNLLLKRF